MSTSAQQGPSAPHFQCPYTASSCPLFNPTFSAADVIGAGEVRDSQKSSLELVQPPDKTVTALTSSSLGLVDAMRSAHDLSPNRNDGGAGVTNAMLYSYADYSIAPSPSPAFSKGTGGRTVSGGSASPPTPGPSFEPMAYGSASLTMPMSPLPGLSPYAGLPFSGRLPSVGLSDRAGSPFDALVAPVTCPSPRLRPSYPPSPCRPGIVVPSAVSNSYPPQSRIVTERRRIPSGDRLLGGVPATANTVTEGTRSERNLISTATSGACASDSRHPSGLEVLCAASTGGSPRKGAPYPHTGKDPMHRISNGIVVAPLGLASTPLSTVGPWPGVAEPLIGAGAPGFTPDTFDDESVWGTSARDKVDKTSGDDQAGGPAMADAPSVGAALPGSSAAHDFALLSAPRSTTLLHSGDGQQGPDPATSGLTVAQDSLSTTATPFITKLQHVLDNPTHQDVICWSADGHSLLYQHTSPRLLEILGKYFRHTSVTSLARQLNIYAFRRLNVGELLRELERIPAVTATGLTNNPEIVPAAGAAGSASASEWSGFTHPNFWRDGPGRLLCELWVLKPQGPKTDKGKANLAKKLASEGTRKRKRKGAQGAKVGGVRKGGMD